MPAFFHMPRDLPGWFGIVLPECFTRSKRPDRIGAWKVMIAWRPSLLHRTPDPMDLWAAMISFAASTTSRTIAMSCGRNVSEFPPMVTRYRANSKCSHPNRSKHAKAHTLVRFARADIRSRHRPGKYQFERSVPENAFDHDSIRALALRPG